MAIPAEDVAYGAVLLGNGDGKLDQATLSSDNAGNQNLNIALGNGEGTLQLELTIAAPQEPHPPGCFRGLISTTMAAST